MSKVTLRTLKKDVLDAAIAVALESLEGIDGLPAAGTSVEVTSSDRRLWNAALRLNHWKTKRKVPR